MALELPDSWSNYILAVRLDRAVHEEVGDFALRAPDRFSRSQELRRIFRGCATRDEFIVREHAKPYVNAGELARELQENFQIIRFIEERDSPWLVVAGWTFGDPSQQLNTASVLFSLRHAYRTNWVAKISVGGYVACTLMKEEYMAWLGIPKDDHVLFQGDPATLAHVFDPPTHEIRKAVDKALVAPAEEHGADIVAVGTLMAELGIWSENWREYFAQAPHAKPTETYLLLGSPLNPEGTPPGGVR